MSILLGVVALAFIYSLVTAADKLTPAGMFGEARIAVMFVVMAGLLTGATLIIDAATSAPSHPSLAYSPAKFRELMNRKCILQSKGQGGTATDILYTAYCTALDSPDLPKDLQGMGAVTGYQDPMRILDDRNIKYKTSNFWLGAYLTNDPQDFSPPVLFYKDGTRPENSLLRFWETKAIR